MEFLNVKESGSYSYCCALRGKAGHSHIHIKVTFEVWCLLGSDVTPFYQAACCHMPEDSSSHPLLFHFIICSHFKIQ